MVFWMLLWSYLLGAFFGVVKISLVFCLSLCVGGESTPPRLCSEDAIHATTIHVIPNHSETKSIIFQNGQKFPELPPIGVLAIPENGHLRSKTYIFCGYFQKNYLLSKIILLVIFIENLVIL